MSEKRIIGRTVGTPINPEIIGGGGGAGLSNDIPLANGIESAGVAKTASRADHVHPTDTSRMPSAESMGGITELDYTDSFIVYDVPGKVHKILAWQTFVKIIENKLNERLNIVSTTVADTETGYTATLPELEDDAVLVITKDLENYLSANDLSAAIDAALAEAKAIGEFDGEDGEDGADGKDGSAWWYINQYIDGTPLDMVSDDAKNGDYCLHATEGHVYYAKDGKWKQIGNIKGYTPIKGKDYFTEADKEEIVGELADAAPVRSVNGKTGAVSLSAPDVGAAPSDKTITITGVDESGTTHTWTVYGGTA